MSRPPLEETDGQPGPTSVVIEADGGSRGNPGPAAYGAVLKDAETGRVIAEDGTTIGIASNNVAEYRGLIAGLRLAAEFAPDADIEVRMDSKLVVEQMSGRWKIKHPDMKPLALEANRLAPFGTIYTWVPREQNKHADRLANEALDGKREGVSTPAADWADEDAGADQAAEPDELAPVQAAQAAQTAPAAPTGDAERTDGDEPRWVTWRKQEQTTVILVRHGVTEHTSERRFSGGLNGTNPGLSEEGRAQVELVADWLSTHADRVSTVVASPVRRARESGEILAERLDAALEEEPGFAEMDFGTWDGLTFDEVAEGDRAALEQWLGSVDVRPGGGESLEMVRDRVLAALDRLLDRHVGSTVVVASHVTPIKVVAAEALGAPLTSQFRMELRPASVTVVTVFTPPAEAKAAADAGQRATRFAAVRQLNMLAPGVDLLDESTRW